MRKVLTFLVLLSFPACVTTYQRAGVDSTGRGYGEIRLKEDVWHVYFQGGNDADAAWVRAALLYRCAELAFQAGYDHFLILDNNIAAQRSTARYGSGHYNATISETATGYSVQGTYTPPLTIQRESFRAEAVIQGGYGPPPTGDPGAFDSASAMKRLRSAVFSPR